MTQLHVKIFTALLSCCKSIWFSVWYTLEIHERIYNNGNALNESYPITIIKCIVIIR